MKKITSLNMEVLCSLAIRALVPGIGEVQVIGIQVLQLLKTHKFGLQSHQQGCSTAVGVSDPILLPTFMFQDHGELLHELDPPCMNSVQISFSIDKLQGIMITV